MVRILVTGGAGFIGRHLCRSLMSDGHQVFCLDNFLTGGRDKIQKMAKNQNFKYIEHDVIYPYLCEADEIYNLACPASPIKYQKDPIHTLKTNVLGALNMLELAEINNAKILLSSTSEIYGDPKIHPQSENYCGNVNPVGIRSCYDEGKRCAETLFNDFMRQRKVRTKIARLFNTYGPGMYFDDGRVISTFVFQALQGKDITVNGDGTQTRSFCYISDVVDGLRMMMESPDTITGPLNIGNPEEITVLAIAEKIIELCKSKSKICFNKRPSDDPQKRKPDISKVFNNLGWSPKISLEEGLIETIKHMKRVLSTSPYSLI